MKRAVLLFYSVSAAACTQVPTPASSSQEARACAPSTANQADTGISPESGSLEPFVYPFIEKVNRLPNFSDLWIQHNPRYHVVAAFTEPPPLSEVRRLAPPEIRDRIEVRTAKRDRFQIAAMRDEIVRQLQTAGLKGWSSSYNPKTQCFEISLASETDVAKVRALLTPEQRIDADVRFGPIPHLL